MFIQTANCAGSKISYLSLDGPDGEHKRLVRNDLWIKNAYEKKNPQEICMKSNKTELENWEPLRALKDFIPTTRAIYETSVTSAGYLLLTDHRVLQFHKQFKVVKQHPGTWKPRSIEMLSFATSIPG